MPRINRTHSFLLSDESPERVSFDVVYRPEVLNAWSTRTLMVDYDLSRLGNLQTANWKCAELEDLDGPYQRILMQVSPFDSLRQVKRDVYAASRILSPDGELRVTIPPKSGAKRIASDLNQVFKTVDPIKTAGLTLLICREPIPQVFPEEPCELEYDDPISGRSLKFSVRPGIFSSEKVDTGTAFLLNTIRLIEGQTILDVGCGYGAIGVTAAARGAEVTLLDVDARVVKLAKQNLSENGLAGNVLLKLQPYDFKDRSFDVVLANPPTHAGSATLRELFNEMVRVSSRYVALVVREHLNYEKWLNEIGRVQKLGTAEGFKVLQINKP